MLLVSVLGTAAIGTMATDQAASAEPPGADDTSQEPGGRTDTPTLGFAETAPPNLSNPVDPPYTVELGPGVDRGLAPFVPEPATITVRPGQPLGDVPLPPGVFMPPGVNLPPAVQEALVQKAQEIGAYLDAHSDALVGDNRRSEDLVAMYEATRGAINDTHVFEALNDLGIERTTFEVNVGVLGSAERNAGDVTKGKVEGGLTYRLAVEAGPYIASANPQIAVSLIQIEQVGAAVGLRDLPGWYGLIDPEYGTAQEHHKGVAISYVMPPGEPLPDTLPSLFAPGDMRESSTLRITPVHAEWAQDRYLNYHQDAVDIATTEAGDPGMIQVTRTGDTVELGTGNLQVHISEPGVHSTVKGFREALTLRDVTGDVYFPGNLTFDHTDPAGRAAYETALRQGIPDFGFPEGTTVYARFGMTDPLHYTTTPSLSLPLKSENGQRQVGPYVNANRIGHHPWHGWVQAVAVGPEIGAKVNFSWFDTFGDRRFTGAGDLVVRDGRYGVANIEGQLTNRLFSSLPGGSVKLSAAQIAQLRDLYSQSRLRTITDQEFVDRLYSIVPEFAALRDNRGVGMALEPVLAYDLPAFLGMIPDSDQVRSLVEGSVRAAAPPGTLIAFDGSVPDVTGAVPEPPDAFDAYALSLPAGALGPDADFSAAFNGVPNSFGVIGVPDGPGGIGTLLGPDPGFGFGSPEPFGSYADAAAAGAVGVDADFGGAFAESGSPFAEAFAGYGESGVPGISISGEGLDGPGYGESGVPGISVSEGGGADGLSDPGVAQTGTLGSEVEGSDDADDGVGTYAAAAVAAGAVGVDADFGGAFAESGSPFAEAFAGYGESGVPGISISGEGLDGPGYSESGVPGISVSEGEAGYAPSEPSFSQTGTLSNDLGEVGDGPTDGDAAGAADESGAPGISVSEDGDGYTPSEPSFAQTGTLGNDPAAEPGSSTVDSFGGSEDSGTVDGFGGSEDSSTGVGGFGGSEDSSTGVGDVGGPGSVTGETDTGRGLGVAGEPAIGSGDDGGGSGDRGAGGTGSGDDGSRSTEGGVPGTSVSVDGDGYAASESSFSQTGTLGNEASGSDDGFGSSLVDSFGGFGDSAGGFGGGDDGSGGFGDSAGGFGGGDSGSGGFGDSAGGFGGGDSGSGGFGDSGFGGGDSGSGGSGGGDSGSSSFSTSSGSFGGGDSGW